MDNRALTAERYRTAFDRLRPLILEEWPAVDGAALADTAGDLERAVQLIAERTGHSRGLVQLQLAELCAVATAPSSAGGAVESVLSALEARARRALEQVRKDVLPRAEGRVRENLWVSLALAVGLGVLLGFFLRGPGRGR